PTPTSPTPLHPLSLHDALPICAAAPTYRPGRPGAAARAWGRHPEGLDDPGFKRSVQVVRGTVKWFDPAKGFGFISQSGGEDVFVDRKSTRLNSSHVAISYAVFC